MINKLKEYYNVLGIKFFLYKIVCSILPTNPIKNTKLLTLNWQKKCVNKLKKYVLNKEEFPIKKINKNISEKTIWVMWIQGEENMPPIVKKCYNSIIEYADEYNVILLNRKNISNYIEFPKFVVDKYDTGKITNAIFSDLVRIELLSTYGGIWIDATVLLTGKIPKIVKESEIFMFQSSKLEYNIIKMSSWFISSRHPENYVITSIRNVILTYWHKENKAINPFVFHLIVSSLYTNEKKFKKEWDMIPYICNMTPHVMWFSFSEKYSDRLWKHLKDSSSIHKLSWKFKENCYSDDTICKYILNNNMPKISIKKDKKNEK